MLSVARSLVHYSRYLRRTAFPVDSEHGRSAERYRLAVLGAMATAGSRLMGAILMVLTVYWAAPVLTSERFGIWAAFSGLLFTSSFLDFGVGNALINRVAHAVAEGDPRYLKSVVTGGMGWLVVIGFGASIILTAASAYIPWIELLKLKIYYEGAEARRAAVIFSGIFGLNIIANGFLKVLVGQQKSHEANLIATIAALLACPATWFATKKVGDVGWILAAGFGVQIVAVILPVLVLTARRGMLGFRKCLSSMVEQRSRLFASGSFFLLLQVGTTIGWGADTLLLASVAGASEVAALAVVQRLFLLASQPVAILVGPLWASYADARARGDRDFIMQTLRRTFIPSIALGASLGLGLLVIGPWLISLWTKNAIEIPWSLLIAFAIWVPFECGGIAWGTFLNGTGVVREQVLVTTCFCVFALPAKLLAAARFGATGLVSATIIAYAIVIVGGYAVVYRRDIFKRLGPDAV